MDPVFCSFISNMADSLFCFWRSNKIKAINYGRAGNMEERIKLLLQDIIDSVQDNEEMVRLTERLKRVSDAYGDFVVGVLTYAKKKPDRLKLVNTFMDNNPMALSADIIAFISVQDDFYENACIADEDIEIALDYRFGLTDGMSAAEMSRGQAANDKLSKLLDDFKHMVLE